MKETVDRAIEVARTKQGIPLPQARHEHVDVRALNTKCAALLQGLPTPVPLTFSVDDNFPALIVSDPTLLWRCLLNFTTNALNNTDEGTVTVRWALGASQRSGDVTNEDLKDDGDSVMVRLEVADTGCGVPYEWRDAIWEPYVQTDYSKSGTGIGLKAVRQCVDMLHGTCGVDTNGSRGALFWCEVPCGTVDGYATDISLITIRPSEPHLSPTLINSADTGPHRDVAPRENVNNFSDKRPPRDVPLRCLVVDDSGSVRKLLVHMMKRSGVETEEAADGQAALDVLCDSSKPDALRHFDFMLIDFLMPVLDGPGCVKAYRAWESPRLAHVLTSLQTTIGDNAHVKPTPLFVIGISANADDETIAKTLADGMNAFTKKPVHVKILNALLAEQFPGRYPSTEGIIS